MRREAKFKHYKPKRWEAAFDLIVLESTLGKSNAEIARKYGYTPQHVSNILSTEEASKVKERVRGSIDKEVEKGISERLRSMGEKALKHVEVFIEDEANLASKRPFEFVDRALKIAQSVGQVKGEDSGNGSTVNIGVIVNNEQATRLLVAIDKSSELDDVKIEMDPAKLVNDTRTSSR